MPAAKFRARFRAMHPGVSGIFVENRANGAAAIGMVKQRIPGINRVNPVKSKYDSRCTQFGDQFFLNDKRPIEPPDTGA